MKVSDQPVNRASIRAGSEIGKMLIICACLSKLMKKQPAFRRTGSRAKSRLLICIVTWGKPYLNWICSIRAGKSASLKSSQPIAQQVIR